MKLTKSIGISITEGRVVRDLFYNGFFDSLNDSGYKILIISPVARVPQFVETWSKPGVSFANLPPYILTARDHRLLGIRKRMMLLGRIPLAKWMALEHQLWKSDSELISLLKENNCHLSVITHPMFHSEMPVYLAAKALNLPTLGVLRSWDNLFKGLRIRPDKLAVWNPVNRQEAIDLMKYHPERVVALGGTQFDAYFSPEANWSRERFAQALNLDPARPIITLATLGAFLNLYDETYLVDILLSAINAGRINGHPQLVIRLHPASRVEHFSKYQHLSDVRISHVTGYIPTLGWTMTREDVIFMANLLRHSDVVVSPGSTITIETAIFDTPTVVPVFNTYQPELGDEQYDHHLSMHFKRLAEQDLIPLISEPEDLIPAVNRSLTDRSWYREQRAQLVRDYILYTDGKSTERLIDLIINMAQKRENHR